MRQLVGGFDPSLEPLRPMGQAHRGVPKVRRPPKAMGVERHWQRFAARPANELIHPL